MPTVSSANPFQLKNIFANVGTIRVSSSTIKIPARTGPNGEPIATPSFYC